MELDLNTSRLPLPKDVNFDTAASLLLKSNKSILVLKKEILIKLKHRAKNVILPLIKSDFKLTRKVQLRMEKSVIMIMEKLTSFLRMLKR